MFHLSVLLSKIRSPFKLLEKKLLKELHRNLSPEAQSQFRKQVDGINLVQRQANKREVCCFTIKKGKPYRNPALQFRANGSELKFASIRFTVPNHEKPWDAEFYLVNGFFFSIVFTPSATPIQNTTEVIIESVCIMHDPAIEISDEKEITTVPGTVDFHGWLLEWAQAYEMRDVRLPLEPEERQQFLERVDAGLPEDYLEMLEQCEGFAIQNIQVLGLSDLYDVVVSEHEFYLLAEVIEKGMIGVKKSAGDGKLYYLDYEGGGAVEIGNSFCQAIEILIAADTK